MPINFKGVPVRDGVRGNPGDSWILVDPIRDKYEWFDVTATSGGTATYVHDQPVASSTWVINHNLLYFPNVSLVDSTGREIYGEVNWATVNQVIVTLTPAVAGKAYLS